MATTKSPVLDLDDTKTLRVKKARNEGKIVIGRDFRKNYAANIVVNLGPLAFPVINIAVFRDGSGRPDAMVVFHPDALCEHEGQRMNLPADLWPALDELEHHGRTDGEFLKILTEHPDCPEEVVREIGFFLTETIVVE